MAAVVDSHHHLWRYSREEYGWIGPEMAVLQRDFLPADMEREMAVAGVSGSVAVQARQSVEETRWLLECAESSATIRGVVGWLPIAAEDFPAILGEFGGFKALKGLRHVIQDEPDDGFILRESFNKGIAAMLGSGLVYDILIHERHLPQAAECVRRHPEQVFVLDHLAKPKIRAGELQPWKKNLTQLASHDNVFCKVSGMATEADWTAWTLDDLRPYLDAAVEAFGSMRLMAGSDWPVCLVASEYKRWWDTLREWAECLDAAGRDALFGDTASRVYRLGHA